MCHVHVCVSADTATYGTSPHALLCTCACVVWYVMYVHPMHAQINTLMTELGKAPIHAAITEAYPSCLRVLLEYNPDLELEVRTLPVLAA